MSKNFFFLLGKQRALVRFFSGLLSNKIFPFLQMPQAPKASTMFKGIKKAMTKRCTFGGIQYQTGFFFRAVIPCVPKFLGVTPSREPLQPRAPRWIPLRNFSRQVPDLDSSLYSPKMNPYFRAGEKKREREEGGEFMGLSLLFPRRRQNDDDSRRPKLGKTCTFPYFRMN